MMTFMYKCTCTLYCDQVMMTFIYKCTCTLYCDQVMMTLYINVHVLSTVISYDDIYI